MQFVGQSKETKNSEMPRIPTPESGVLKACLDILAAHKIWHERRNIGAVRDGKRFVRFGRPGTADIHATPMIRCPAPRCPHPAVCTTLWVECKSASGRQTGEQKEFEREAWNAGHFYLIVRKPEDLLTWLREHGVIK